MSINRNKSQFESQQFIIFIFNQIFKYKVLIDI
jgi:hypothetical protein